MKFAIALSAALAFSAASAMACSFTKTDTQASLRSNAQQTAAASQGEQSTVFVNNTRRGDAAKTATE